MPLHAPARHRARHAAPGPASTPLTGLTEAVAARAGGVARRGAVVVASTGLVMTLGVTASSAEPLVEEQPAPALTAPAERVETPQQSVPEPAATAALTVAADVPVSFARGAAPAVTAPPPPPPPPAPVVVDEPEDEDSDEVSRSSDDGDEDSRAEEPVSRSAERVAVDPGSSSQESGSDDSSQESSSDDGSSEESGSEESGSEETGSEETGSDDGGSSESSSDDGSSDDGSSEESGSEETGSEETGSDDGGSSESSSEEAPEAPAAASSAGSSVLDIAAQYVGTPYAYGGTSPSGFDCSGFTQYVFAQAGISLPRTAASQGAGGTRVSRSEARPGDLAVVSDGSHVGIYAGDNQWYDSPRPGKSVSLRDIWTSDVYFVRY